MHDQPESIQRYLERKRLEKIQQDRQLEDQQRRNTQELDDIQSIKKELPELFAKIAGELDKAVQMFNEDNPSSSIVSEVLPDARVLRRNVDGRQQPLDVRFDITKSSLVRNIYSEADGMKYLPVKRFGHKAHVEIETRFYCISDRNQLDAIVGYLLTPLLD